MAHVQTSSNGRRFVDADEVIANRMQKIRTARTADEESVAHAWNTIPVNVWVDVDAGIAPLVMALNKIAGIRTRASCQGHRLSVHEPRAYVMISWISEDARQSLIKMLAPISDKFEYALSGESSAMLLADPDAVTTIAQYIEEALREIQQ